MCTVLAQEAIAGQSLFCGQLPFDRLRLVLALTHAQVPRHLWRDTPIRLKATAGMRLLSHQQREAILLHCRSMLASSDFAFRPDCAHVISGQDEALYAWVGANYVAGALQVGVP